MVEPRTKPAAGPRRHGLCACRRARQPPQGTDRPARQARGLFRRQDAHHRFRAVQRAQFRHPPPRRRHPVQGALADPPSAARLELPAARAKRELRHPAGQPARLGDAMVRGHGRRRLPEHRHHRGLRSRIHGHPRRRPHLQDGLRADAAASTSTPAPTSPSAASKCRAWRRPASASCMSTRRTTSSPSSKSRPIRPAFPTSRTSRWPRWASTSSSTKFLMDAAAPRCRRSEHPAAISARTSFPISSRTARRSPIASPSPACAPIVENEAYWRDVGTIDAYWEANIDLTDIAPELDLYDQRLADLDLCRD